MNEEEFEEDDGTISPKHSGLEDIDFVPIIRRKKIEKNVLESQEGLSKENELKDYYKLIKHFTAKSFFKSKIYLKPEEEPPEGAKVQRGPRGGIYYEERILIKKPSKPVLQEKIKPGFKEMSELDFSDIFYIKEDLYNEGEIPSFENVIVTLNGEKYYMVVEEWFPDCLESRNLGETTQDAIEEQYLDIMHRETGLQADISGYLPGSNRGEYGISYIMQKIITE